MAARDKIIKLERISAEDLGREQEDTQVKCVQSAPAHVGHEDDLLKFDEETSLLHHESFMGTEPVAPGRQDSVPGIPAAWPQIPQLFQRHSWNFSTAVSPSINKAVGHLELLQTVIEEWIKETEASRASSKLSKSKKSQQSSKPQSRKQLHFSDGGTETKDLSVQGIGAVGPQGIMVPAHGAGDDEDDFPYLGAEEVVEDTITLLAKLETDRQETVAKLHLERERVKMLGEKIDRLAAKRLLDLPAAVQKEHEACATSITQLNWHVVYKSKSEERLQTKVAVAAALNKKLKEDVEFVHSHIPLVKEKLELEQEAMERIETAQDETNDELRLTEHHYQMVLEKSSELHMLADKERMAIKKDLDGVRADLKNISAELEEAKKQYLNIVGGCEYCTKKLRDDKEELKVLLVKEENAKTKQEMQAAKVKVLKEEIITAEYEHGRLAKYIGNLTREKDTKFLKNQALREKLEKEIAEKTESLRQLSRKNKEVQMDIEDMEIKIKTCKKQREKDEKNLLRMQKELERTEKLMEVTEDELGQSLILNSSLKEQLRTEEDKCCTLEEQLRQTAEALKKQVKDEMHNRTVLVARINSDTSESEKFEVEAREKMIKANRKYEEVHAAVQKVKEKVDKYRREVDDRLKNVRECEEKIGVLTEARDAMEKKTDAELMSITPIHKELEHAVELQKLRNKLNMCPRKSQLQLALCTLDKKIEHMDKKTDMMTKKMEDMTSQSTMMEKSFKNTNKQIENLEEVQTELDIQMETNKKLDEDIVAAIDDVVARTEQRAKVHRDLIKERREVYAEQEEELWKLLESNRKLAAQYRALQNEYIVLKNKLLDTYDDKVLSENAIKDIRQLQSLQKRLQAAMLEYYKYRGLYNQAELGRMEGESNHNGVRVGTLKESMDVCLNKIAHFLTHTFDVDSVHDRVMDKLAKEEADSMHQQAVTVA